MDFILIIIIISFILGLILNTRFIHLFGIFILMIILFIYILLHLQVILIPDYNCYTLYHLLLFNYFNFNNLISFTINKKILIKIAFLISFILQIFIFWYLITDKHIGRLIIIFWLFVSSFLLYLANSNFTTLFINWEIFGFISGILICFWKRNNYNIYSCIKALIYNRIGDYFLSLSLYFISNFTFSDNFIEFLLSFISFNNYLNLILLLIGFGIISKSAQFPFFPWLYHAMSAPTPISCLLHAATMVTAGSYLSYIIFTYIPIFIFNFHLLFIFNLLCCFTLIITSLLSYYTNDMKRIIAYSTSGQLAIIIISILSYSTNTSLLHLIIHAFFKSLVFLSIASIIHNNFNNQDIRYTGLNIYLNTILITSLLFGCISMFSFPMTSAFFSKDFIILSILLNNNILSIFISIILTISVIFTTLYSINLIKVSNSYPSITHYIQLNTHYITIEPIISYFIFIILSISFSFIYFNIPINFISFYFFKSLWLNYLSIILLLLGLLSLLLNYIISFKSINYYFIYFISSYDFYEYYTLFIALLSHYLFYNISFKLNDKYLLLLQPSNYIFTLNLNINYINSFKYPIIHLLNSLLLSLILILYFNLI